MAVLAIDQGTTSTRAFVLDDTGKGEIVKTLTHRQFYPEPGWVEHDPRELVDNIRACLDAGMDAKTAITALGIDNQGESCLAWDARTKTPLTRVIVWQDDRTRDTIEDLKARGKESLTLRRAGLPLNAYFSAAKLGWIFTTLPGAIECHAQGRLRLGTTDAYFLDCLAGLFVTDITTASRTSLMNLSTGQWDKDLCALFKVPVDALPRIVPTSGLLGNIMVKGGSLPIRASVVDQQAALFGHRCTNPGDTKITFGTGAFALTLTGDRPLQAPEQGLLPTVAWQQEGAPPVYALDGGVFSAGSAVSWGKSIGLFTSYDQINAFRAAPAIERNLAFVPALSGLGCPHWDRTAGGLWIGLSLDTTPLDMMQSLLEGIVFRTAEVMDAMENLLPLSDQISVDGGLTDNPYFCQFLADVLYRDIIVPSSPELTALGTACLAGGIPATRNSSGSGTRQFHPITDRRSQLDRFKEALKRSNHWQS